MALMQTVTSQALTIRPPVLRLLQPGNQNWFEGRYDREEFRSDAFPAFDPIQAATVAAGLTFDAILNPERLTRMMHFHDLDPTQLSVEDVLDRVTGLLSSSGVQRSGEQAINEAVYHRYISGLISLAGQAQPRLAARVEAHLAAMVATDVSADSQRAVILRQIRRFLERPAPAAVSVQPLPPTPPGSPIGSGLACSMCWFCEPML